MSADPHPQAAKETGAAQVRRLVPGEWEHYRAVRLAGLAEAPYAFASSLEREEAFDEAEWRRRLASTAHFGAWHDGSLVGLAATFPETSDAAPQVRQRPGEPPAWHLVAMWVSPQHRARGIGDRLVERVCELARGERAGAVALWVTDANPRALAFYRRLGFRSTGERAEVRPGEWEERMIRSLGA